MGCNQSKLENEEAVSRCKERKHFMKNAVAARNAFAAAHSSYAVSLRTTGGALNGFFRELTPNPSAVAAVATSPGSIPFSTRPPIDTLPPPPPPPSDGSNSLEMHSPSPLHRAISMPEYVASKSKMEPSEAVIEEEDEEDFDDETNLKRRGRRHRSAGVGGSVRGRMMRDGEGPPPPPSPPPETPPINRAVPPPPVTSESAWDYYIFGIGGMTGGSLRDVEDLRKESEERERIERKVMEETAERSETDHATNAGSYDKVGGVGGGEGIHRNGKAEEMAETVVEKPPFPPQQLGDGKMLKRGKQVLGAATAGGGSEGKRAGMTLNLLQIFNYLDDWFLKASESAHDVSKMLEATKLHYHSNFADNRGHIDHSATVMRVITWNRSFRGLTNADNEKDNFDSEDHETHATVLDKLLAWEKKLYDEVKAGELMKFDYQRKVAVLNKQKKRGTNSEALEKAKAAVSHLHTRYIVDMQSLDSTVAEINRLRDEQLYPKLAELVNAMAMMWESMQIHHENQLKMAAALKVVDLSQCTIEMTESLYSSTYQLLNVVEDWHLQFEKMVSNQKEYIKALNSWLKLNLIPIESSLKEKVSSPPRAQNPPIQRLLLAWHDFLEKLPDEHAKGAIFSFAAFIQTIIQQQEEEMKLKQQCDASRKDLMNKSRKFEDWHRKYMEQRTPEEMDPDGSENNSHLDMVSDKQSVVQAAQKKLEEDEEKYQRQCIHVRDKTLASLRARMPELFQAMSEFAYACADMYRNLKAISHSQKHKQRESSSQ